MQSIVISKKELQMTCWLPTRALHKCYTCSIFQKKIRQMIKDNQNVDTVVILRELKNMKCQPFIDKEKTCKLIELYKQYYYHKHMADHIRKEIKNLG